MELADGNTRFTRRKLRTPSRSPTQPLIKHKKIIIIIGAHMFQHRFFAAAKLHARFADPIRCFCPRHFIISTHEFDGLDDEYILMVYDGEWERELRCWASMWRRQHVVKVCPWIDDVMHLTEENVRHRPPKRLAKVTGW